MVVAETLRDSHLSHMKKIAFALAIFVFLLFLLNRQWLRENTLVNSPSFDALVYQNQSYDDYLLIRESGPAAIYKKYTDGRWHVPPTHMFSGTLCYLLLGRDPANFYIFPAVWFYLMVLATYGFIHLFTGRVFWAALGAALMLSTPSMINFGLRVSQTDFAVGAWFAFATYVLAATSGLLTKRGAVAYALCASATLLFKSSIAPYFLAHALIWGAYMAREPEMRWRRFANALLMAAITLSLIGWYYFNNMRQIIAYYTAWGGEMSSITAKSAGITSRWDEWIFYIRSFAAFHIQGGHQWLYASAAIASIALWVAALLTRRKKVLNEPEAFGIAVAAIWFAVPYLILSMYKSKAYSVDFPFTSVFYILPILFLASLFKGKWKAPVVAIVAFGPFLFNQSIYQANLFFKGQNPQSFREAEILGDILANAETRGMKKITVSNAFVDKYLTSENLRFFVLNGAFPKWQNGYKIIGFGYFKKADDYFTTLKTADYVLAKSGNLAPPTHPDNVLAPAVNKMLATSGEFTMMKRYDLPDASNVAVYINNKTQGINYPEPMADGWIGPRFPLTFYGGVKKAVITGRAPLPKGDMYPAGLYLENADGEKVARIGSVANGDRFEITFDLPDSIISKLKEKPVILYLSSDRMFKPSDFGSTDTRELSILFKSIEPVKGTDLK